MLDKYLFVRNMLFSENKGIIIIIINSVSKKSNQLRRTHLRHFIDFLNHSTISCDVFWSVVRYFQQFRKSLSGEIKSVL